MTKGAKKKSRFKGYEKIDMKDVVSFGTTLFLRKDGKAIKIVFPCGTTATFAPTETVKKIIGVSCGKLH